MRYREIMEKSEPNNPQLWGRAKAEASKRYKKHSAYKMGWASKWYKEKGGTWKTVSETVDDMITEIIMAVVPDITGKNCLQYIKKC